MRCHSPFSRTSHQTWTSTWRTTRYSPQGLTIKATTDENIEIVEVSGENATQIAEEADEDYSNIAPLENAEPYDPRKELSHYIIPKFYDKYKDQPLLTDYPVDENAQNEDEKEANCRRIVETLKKFGIGIKKIYCGLFDRPPTGCCR